MFNNNLGLKRKIKLVIAYTAIGISLTYLLAGFEYQAWTQAINLTTKLFYHEQSYSNLTIPHAGDTTENLLRWNFGSEASLAKAVFKSESGLRCEAVGDTDLQFTRNGIVYGASYGIAQIRYLPGRPTPDQLKDCKFAITYAKQLRDKQGGFQAWSAYSNGSYKKFLN